MQGLRHRVHAGDTDRHLHGVVRRRLRRLLQLRPLLQGGVAPQGAAVVPASDASRVGKWSEQEVLDRIETIRRRAPRLRDETINMSHGAGGKASHTLIEALFRPAFGNLSGDAALVEVDGTRLALTTDTYVVSPLFFPGGDIGELAVNGTVNDLAVAAAPPR